MTVDAAGTLYVTTRLGGAYGAGAIVKLTPNSNGTWTESNLHSFTGGSDGYWPYGAVLIGNDRNLYGTTPYGGVAAGQSGFGVVYSLRP